MFTQSQVIEAFHLTFLEVLRHHVSTDRYILKGGANLRYFFGSDRYSEDIDFDVCGVEVWKLREKVDSALGSVALTHTLRSVGLAVAAIHVGKQTDATRRWSVHLQADGHDEPIRTKLEFSGRNGEHRHDLEAVPVNVVKDYGIRAPTVRHYRALPAIKQKVIALELRTLTQARDVFDLDLLLRKEGLPRDEIDPRTLKAAAERAVSLSYNDFNDQVRAFLHPDVADLYDEIAWAKIQGRVAEELLA